MTCMNLTSRLGGGFVCLMEMNGPLKSVIGMKDSALKEIGHLTDSVLFQLAMATAGKVCIAEVEELVEVGELDADQIHTPSIYVNRIVVGESFEKRIERRTTRPKE